MGELALQGSGNVASRSFVRRRRGGAEHDADPAAVLVVDDTPGNLFAFRELLGPVGHRIVEATSGDAAIALAARQDFAAILLDVMMPGMDGFETLSRMREGDLITSTPVIMITARELSRAELDRAYSLGVIDF